MHARLHSAFFRTLVSCLSILVCSCANAGTTDKTTELQGAARQQQLWLHPEWLNLLHYDRRGSGFLSQVDDSRFFNAMAGKTDPQAEMLATLAAFYGARADDDAHPQCRFPARLEWLRRRLAPRLTDLPAATCTLYKEWRASVPDERLALIFPAYHLNSPSSMFGHTLLRLDSAKVETDSEWLSIAVNFGADVRADDNSIFYAFKGLSGGYPGFFIVTPYFKKIREYIQDEKRDMWEYRLNLRPDEIKNLVTHLWELKETRFDYYFFDENCSYRLLELLEVARPGIELTDAFDLTAIPVDTVRAVANAGLIQSAAYRPSQVTLLQHLLSTLPESSHALIQRIADDPEQLDSAEFQALDGPQQKNVVDSAYQYLRYQQGTGPREPKGARNRYRLLEKLNSFPVSEAVPVPRASPPEAGHFSRRASLALGHSDHTGFVDIGYRFSFHSLEDNDQGFLRGAQINLGNIQLRAYENSTLRLQQLDLVDIFSLTPRSALFSPLSWRIYTGLERQLTSRREVLTAHVTGGAGVSYELMQNNLTYLMAGLRLEHNSAFANLVEPAVTALIGGLHHFGRSTAHLQLGAEEFANRETRYNARYTHNFVVDTQQAIRLQIQREHHEGLYRSASSLAYLRYF